MSLRVFALLLSLLYRLLFLCQHLFKLYLLLFSRAVLVLCLCCASCCARRLDSKGSNIGFHTCKTHANTNTGTHVAPHARLVPLLMLAHLLHPMQNPCQLWTKRRKVLQHKQNTCQLLSCKSRANSYPQVIHRLPHAILVPLPMLAQMLLRKKRANCWTNVGGGEGVAP